MKKGTVTDYFQKGIILLAWIAIFSIQLNGCAFSPKYKSAKQKTIQDIAASENYHKKIGFTNIMNVSDFKDPLLGELLHQTVFDEVKKNSPRMILLSYKDPKAPSFLISSELRKDGEINTDQLMPQAKKNGFQAICVIRIQNIEVKDLKKGVLWFRKDKQYIHIELKASLFDGITFSRLHSEPYDRLIPIDSGTVASFKENKENIRPLLEKELKDMGRTIAKEIIPKLKQMKWSISIVSKNGDLSVLPAGSLSGIRLNSHMEVFSGKRTIQSDMGETFVIPGYSKGKMVIETVLENQSKAKTVSGELPDVGDIVIPVSF